MSDKIRVEAPLVVLHGDEMAQVAFERILEMFVQRRLEIPLVEMDLSAENRLATNGQVVNEAIEALKQYGVGIKNAGMTVNRAQLDELLAKHPEIDRKKLDKLATKSPNGAIRKGIGGNITREDIQFRNIKNTPPDWVGRDIVVDTMDSGGIKDSYSALNTDTGIAKLVFVGESGDPQELHRRRLNKGDPFMLATNSHAEVQDWAREFFQRGLDEKRDVYVGLKDTVIPGYDGVMKDAVEDVFKHHRQPAGARPVGHPGQQHRPAHGQAGGHPAQIRHPGPQVPRVHLADECRRRRPVRQLQHARA